MASFAPAYYQSSNNAWLNELVADIIDPNNRTQCRTYGQDSDDDLVDAPDSGCENATRSIGSSSPSHAGWRPFSPSSRRTLSRISGTRDAQTRLASPPAGQTKHVASKSSRDPIVDSSLSDLSPISDRITPTRTHWKQRSQSNHPETVPPSSRNSPSRHSRSQSINSRASTSFGTSGRMDITTSREDPSEAEQSKALDPYHHHIAVSRYRSTTSSEDHALSVAQKSSAGVPLRAELAAFGGTIQKPVPARHSSRSATAVGSMSSKRTSLGRTMSEKRVSDIVYEPSLVKSLTTSSSTSTLVFGSHPGVRPLQDRKVLGEAAGPHEDEDHEYPGPFALSLIIVGICLAVFIISVDRNIVTTAIPQITATFQSYSDIGWIGSAYFLTASAFQPLYGRAYMSFDTRWTFLLALAVFEVGSLIGALSPNAPVLILGRAIQGFGSAGILTGSFVVGTHSVRLSTRPVLFAFVGILYGVGALAGPLLGGVFTDLLTWRWAFWINLPTGAVTFVGVFFFFKPRKIGPHIARAGILQRILQLDLIGNAILLGACVQLFLALQLSETKGNWSNSPVIGLLCGFGVTTLIFIGWLFYKGKTALLPLHIIRQRTVAASCGAAFFIYGALLIHAYYLPIWFQAIKGDSAIHSGVNMIPYMVANALFSLLAGIFVSKNGLFAPPAILGCAIGTVGSGLLATIGPNTSSGKWIGFEILISAGLGMAIQQGFSAVQTALPLEEVPIGTAAVVASQSLGGAIFVSIGNTLLQDHLLNQNADNAIPGVDVRSVIQLGATMFRAYIPPDKLIALVQLYNRSLQAVFIAAVPLCGIAFLCSLCMEWRSVRNGKGQQKVVEATTMMDEKDESV